MAFNLRSLKSKKCMLFLGLVLVFLIVSAICRVSVLFAGVMVLWTGSVIYTLHDLKNRAGYLVFLLVFFLFLLGGEFFELYMGYAQDFTFVAALDNHAYISLLISLTCLFLGFFGTEWFFRRKEPPTVKTEKESGDYILKIQRVARIGLYIAVFAYFLMTLEAAIYTLQNGYLSYYTTFKSQFPAIVSSIADLFALFLFLFLATMPPKRACMLPMILYLAHGVLALITGRRLMFGVAVLVLGFYMILRQFRNPEEHWVSKKKVLIVLAICPLVLIGMYIQRYVRYGEAIESGNVFDIVFRFLSQQGSSINVIKLQKELEGDSLGCTSLYYTLHYLRGNLITRHIFNFPMEYYTQRTVETALQTNCLADYIIYKINPNDFFAGYGYGTSYIAELYHDLGYIGVGLGSTLYGGLLYWLYAAKRFSFWKFFFGLMMLEEFVILPRYGADVILRPFYNLTRLLVLLLLFLWLNGYMAKIWKKINGERFTAMLSKLKKCISTRHVMLNTPPMGEYRHITDEEVKELQGVMLQIVKDVAEVCEKHNICYMADGGTALGSVRHQGFIPWDDDVDLIMPRDDLNRFVEIFDEELGDKYELVTPNSKGHKVASLITEIYAKNTYKPSLHNVDMDLPQGVMIDIFPLEYAPLNPVVRRIKGTIAMILQYIAVSATFYKLYDTPKKREFFYQTKEGKFNYRFRRLIGFFFSFRRYDKWCNTFDKFVRGKKDTGLWCIPTDVGHYFGHLMPKEVFYPPHKGPFEDMQVNLPNDTHEYLVNAYGDYMWIPPVEQREKHWTAGFCLTAGEPPKKDA